MPTCKGNQASCLPLQKNTTWCHRCLNQAIHDEREDYDELNNKVKLSLLILNRNCKVSPPDDTKSTGNKMAIPQD